MNRVSRFVLNISVIASHFLLGSSVVLAQQESGVLEEVVVTAEKRETSLQDTAISITAFTGDMMRRFGIRDSLDLAKMVPNLNIGARRNEVLVNIRGIQSNNTTEIGDPAVALHLDGVYLSRPRGAAALFYDVERIEVLRGPQGTLYGRNATAGNINIITNKPTNEFDASGEILFGNYNRVSTRGMLNVPVVEDKFMLRAAFMSDKRDGFNKNDRVVDSIESTDDADDVAFRLHGLINITDNLSALITGHYHDIGGVGGNPGFQNLIEDPSDLRVISLNTQPYIDAEVYGFNVQLDWDMDGMALTYLGAFNVDDVKDRLQDADQTTPVFSGAATALFGPFSQWTQVYTHELRLASTGDSRINWLLGLYHFDEEQDVFLYFQPNPGVTVLEFDQFDIGATSKAAFGEIRFDVSDRVELVGGARYTDDRKHRNGETRTVVSGNIVARSPNIGSADSENFDWKVGANFRPADDALYYASVATGYKAGGFNDGIGAPYDPEEVLSYEIGTKLMFQGRRLMLNGSIFYMDYSDLQVSATGIGPTGLPGLFTQNAAEATVQGGEIELVALVGDYARIDASVGYVDATYDEYQTDDPSIPGTLIEDLSGNRLTKAPEWTFNIGAEYEFQLGGLGTLTPRVQFHYEDDQYLREFNKPVDHEDSFTRTDVVISFRHAGGQWYLEGFVNNIEDEDVRNNLQNFPGHGLQYQLDAARTYGVRLGFEL